jgi:hypothetical protein
MIQSSNLWASKDQTINWQVWPLIWFIQINYKEGLIRVFDEDTSLFINNQWLETYCFGLKIEEEAKGWNLQGVCERVAYV